VTGDDEGGGPPASAEEPAPATPNSSTAVSSPEEAQTTSTVVGVHASQSTLWVQVKRGKPEMKVDVDGRLRHANWPESATTLFLGDVCEALLRCFGAHEPPSVTQPPGFDQQKWKMVIRDTTLRIEVHSRSYWGFGLFDSCFLNELVMDGPLDRRSRLAFDLVATLGRNPWEPKFGLMWKRGTGANPEQHRKAWEELLAHASEQMTEDIQLHQDRLNDLERRLDEFEEGGHESWSRDSAEASLVLADHHLETARGALHDRNATAVERALGRVEASLIEADPTTEVSRTPFQLGEDLLLEEAVEVDEEALKEQILVHEELPEETHRSVPTEIATATDDVAADDLLTGVDDEPVDSIPFVDLTESE
jgi:hypothetical protein